MREFITNTLSNVLAGIILAILGSLAAITVTVLNPSVLPYIIIIAIMLTAFVVFFRIKTFGTTSFKWGHIQSFEKHCMLLKADNTGSDIQHFGTIKNKNFKGGVDGYYDWPDISVKQIEFNASNARITLKCKDIKGKISQFTKSNKIILNNDPISAEYDIRFTNNTPEDVHMNAQFIYDPELMEPEYYFDVYRPTKKLILELQVENDVKLHNVNKAIVAEHGDTKEETQVIKGKKSKDNPSITIYKLVVRNPKLLHKYKITWEWLKN